MKKHTKFVKAADGTYHSECGKAIVQRKVLSQDPVPDICWVVLLHGKPLRYNLGSKKQALETASDKLQHEKET